jgi:putative transposase
VSALEEAREEHGFHLWAWVIMPEHVHLLIWPPPVRDELSGSTTRGRLKGILASLKRPVGRKAIAFLRSSAPDYLAKLTVRNRNRTYHRFWQAGPGYDENISHAGILREVADYIPLNPVRRGLVERPNDWIWSSARDLAGLSHVFLKVDRTIPETYEISWTGRRSEI